jgi:hypothetical protein
VRALPVRTFAVYAIAISVAASLGLPLPDSKWKGDAVAPRQVAGGAGGLDAKGTNFEDEEVARWARSIGAGQQSKARPRSQTPRRRPCVRSCSRRRQTARHWAMTTNDA